MTAIQSVDFLIVTALEEERDAVLEELGLKRLNPIAESALVFFGGDVETRFPDGVVGKYRVILICLSRMGRLEAANASGDAIRIWMPQYVLLVGIAGGIGSSDTRLGDVVVSDHVIDYELQKIAESPQTRYQAHVADSRLLNFALNLDSIGWKKFSEESESRRLIGQVLTGDKVISNQDYLKDHVQTWPKLLAVEMEAGGVASACLHSTSKPVFLMIKGISDMADEKKNDTETLPWRKIALKNASGYLRHFLNSAPMPIEVAKTESNRTSKVVLESLRDSIGDQSQNLSDLDRTIGRTDSRELVFMGGQGQFVFAALGKALLENPAEIIEKCKIHQRATGFDPIIVLMWGSEKEVPRNWPMSDKQANDQIAQYNFNSNTGLDRLRILDNGRVHEEFTLAKAKNPKAPNSR